MKKTKVALSLVLASSFLVAGLASFANVSKIKSLKADASDFSIITNLENEKVIHTDQQAAYLSYDGNYETIPEDNYPDGQKHLSDPNPVNLEWSYSSKNGKTVTRYDVVVGKEADLSDGYTIKGTSSASLDVYNSYLGDNYFKVIANFDDGSKDESGINKYKVEESYPRNLKIDGMTNCRDMGGARTLVNDGRIKQGLIFRTSSTSSWAYGRGDVPDTITNDGKEELLNRLGCKTEINVNNSGSAVAGIENYVQAYMYYDGGKHHLYRNGEPIKAVFHALSNPDNYPVFYHCRIGTDRTGLCAILISGLLGVSENDIYQDYLFSNFGNIQEKRYIGEKAGRDNILNYINDLKAFPGEQFHNKVYNYLLSIGVPASELDSVINILTEGPIAQGNNNCQEMVLAKDFYSNDLEAKTSANAVHPSTYYTLEADKSVVATIDAKYSGEAKLVAYLGSTDSSASKKINESVSAYFDGMEVEISDELTFSSVGFGQGDGRTYYSAIVLGDVYVSEGSCDAEIYGIANNLNIGAISVIPNEQIIISGEEEMPEGVTGSEPTSNPSKSSSNGCGGSIIAASSLISLLAVSGTAFLIIKKRRDNQQ